MRKKTELYKEEQDTIIEQLIEILGLDDQMSITLYELDNDQEKIDKIMELVPTIRKYFSASNIKGIKQASQPQSNDDNKVTRPWLSLVRQIVKSKYNMLSCDYRIKKEDQTIRTKKYLFQKIS